MKQTTLFFAGLALLAASCAKTEVISNGAQDNGKGIGFSAYTARHTKAAQEDVTTDNLTSFNVTAIGNSAVYFNDVEFIKGASVWESDTKYFWPAFPLSFYAYNKPVNGTFTPSFTSESQTIAVTPATALANQEDLVAAKAEEKTFASTNENGAIDLTFNHYLTQIIVKAKNSNTTNYKVEVKGAKIARLAGEGTYSFVTEKMVATDGKVNSSTSTSYSTTFETAKTLTEEDQEVMTEGNEGKGRWYLIPQTVKPWDQEHNKTNGAIETYTQYGTYLALNVKITANGGTQKIYPATGDYAWMAVPITTATEYELSQGKKYTFILNFFSNNQGAGYVDPEDPGDLDGDGGTADNGKAITASVIKFSATVKEWDETSATVTFDL